MLLFEWTTYLVPGWCLNLLVWPQPNFGWVRGLDNKSALAGGDSISGTQGTWKGKHLHMKICILIILNRIHFKYLMGIPSTWSEMASLSSWHVIMAWSLVEILSFILTITESENFQICQRLFLGWFGQRQKAQKLKFLHLLSMYMSVKLWAADVVHGLSNIDKSIGLYLTAFKIYTVGLW